jgi:uncharacterized protein (TIGR03083 family)
LEPVEPVHVLDLFPDERAALLEALRSLSDEQWASPTVCEGWTVKDIAQHILADDLGRLSHGRDGYAAARFLPRDDETFEADLLAFIDTQNKAWVEATRRLSPRLITELLDWSGRETRDYFASLDLFAPGLGVSWAGETTSANWFDLAREYTERWHHQAQVREAVGLPILSEPRLFRPVLETFVRALTWTYRAVQAPDGVVVSLRITGDAGGEWGLARTGSAWTLGRNPRDPAARVEMEQDTAWRLFTKTITPGEAQERSLISGDRVLASHILQTVAIIA